MTYSASTMERMDRALRGQVEPAASPSTPTPVAPGLNGCSCPCHSDPHVRHVVACCPVWPEDTGPRFPGVTVQLTGGDGNGFMIVARVRREIERYLRDVLGEGWAEARVAGEEFFNEALSGDYDHLLATVMEWVNVE